jgi:hypothetical protein
MKRLIQSIAGLCVAFSLAGCCYSPGYVDSNNGVMYGGGYQPCNIPDPFAAIFGGCGGCGLWSGGWGTCGATPCASTCETAPCVGNYSGTFPTPVVGSFDGTVISAPIIGSSNGVVVPAPVVIGHPHVVVPSVPAGVFEQATPSATFVPFPPAPGHTGSIIYQSQPSSHRRPVMHDARNQQWVPARL